MRRSDKVRNNRQRPPGRVRAFRFVVVLGFLLILFHALFILWFSRTAAFTSYLAINADGAAAVLRLLGDDATTHGTLISSSRFQIDIKRGCDAIQASAFFVLAVLVSPISAPVRWRLATIVVGTLLLLTINVIRIVSLYYTGVHFPPAFDIMHEDVWQAAFMFLPIICWLLWLHWMKQRGEVRRETA